MLSEHEAAHEALARCHPELERALVALRTRWEPETVPPTTAMGDLGLALVRALSTFSDDELQCVVRVVEDVLKSGSAEARDMVATGFLEAVMSQSQREPRIVRFTTLLGPLAREYCRAWDKFTGVPTPGV
jgi:Fe-S-cluster formation regulator IscX/YfhJ